MRRRWIAGLGALAALAAPAGALAADGDQDRCANAASRTGVSAKLPDCRAYELVSPADKAGGIVAFPASTQGHSPDIGALVQASPDGKILAYWSYQPFGSPLSGLPASHRAIREAGGWTDHNWSPAPPAGTPISPKLSDKVVVIDASEDLSTGFLLSTLAFDSLVQRPYDPSQDGNYNDLYRVDDAGTVTWDSRPNTDTPATSPTQTRFVGRSDDGAISLFESADHLTAEAAGQVAGESLYLRENGKTTLVAAETGGPAVSACGALLSDPFRNRVAPRRGLSRDGSRIFFTAPDKSASGDPSCDDPAKVYVRDHGNIVEVSASQRTVPDAVTAAHFEDASGDGSRVIFKSDSALTDDANPAGFGFLYQYDVPTGDLRLLTPAGEVKGVVATSEDGSHVYYATGDDIYLAAGGTNTKVATINGVNEVAQQELPYWLQGTPPVRVSPDGRHFLYMTYTSQAGFDHGGRSELYLYSADDDRTVCVSCNSAGTPPLGSATLTSDDLVGVVTYPVYRNLSPDGKRVVFETIDALTPGDDNGATDVYEWADGKVTLLSDGQSRYGSFFVDASVDGSSIFIATTASLVARDVDQGAQDIYVARVNGGEPQQQPPVKPCTDNCQGDGQSAPTLPDARIDTSADRPASPDPVRAAPARFTIGKLTKAQKTAFARSGRVTLKVRVTKAAKVSAVGRVTRDKTTQVVARGSGSATKAATVQIKVALSAATRRKLTQRGAATVAVRVSISGGSQQQTLRLRLEGAKKS